MAPSNVSLIFSASSDTGHALAKARLAQGWQVFGTYRQHSPAVAELEALGAVMLYADFSDRSQLQAACTQLQQRCGHWHELVMAPATLEPIGLFESVDFEQWADALAVNFLNPMFVVHRLLSSRADNAQVILFAGGGSNGSADRFSAYTVSKIALTKMTELLDSEVPDLRVTIVGPGWVRTKIHQETLQSPEQAGPTYSETQRRLAQNDFGSMESVIACIDWISRQPKAVVGGRNISVQYDGWGSASFAECLRNDPNTGKLRRFGNTQLNDKSPSQ